MNVKIKRLDDSAILPVYSSPGAAGADLHACLAAPVLIAPGETQLIRTGIAMEIPSGFVGLVYGRSGLALKRDLAPANKVGVIDSDYRGEIMVALHNHGITTQKVEPGERIAQIVMTPCLTAQFELVDDLSGTVRAGGGFGSTGTK